MCLQWIDVIIDKTEAALFPDGRVQSRTDMCKVAACINKQMPKVSRLASFVYNDKHLVFKGSVEPAEQRHHSAQWAGDKVIVERQDEGFLQHALCLANTGYIVYRHNGKVVQLHRMILGLQQGDCQVVDHINRVKTDNRRNNLRLVSYSQNGANMMRKKKLKGVRKHGRRFIARAGFMYKSIHLGCFDTAEQAAAKYNEFMSQKHGIHARLNVI